MNPKVKNWILHYLYGAFASVWNGLFSSAYVAFGASGANAAGLVDLHDITWRGFLSTIGGTILFHAVIYFYGHRLPDDIPTLSAAMKVPAAPPAQPTQG